MRWDPHPEPVTSHPNCAVLYTAYDLETCIGEVFQDRERIDTVAASPFATSWSPTRTLQLLDLTQGWPLRMGESHALLSAPKPTCRNWEHAIWETALLNEVELDGLQVRSTLTGQEMAVLFAASQDSLPAAPAFTSPLNGPVVFTVASKFAFHNRWTLA